MARNHSTSVLVAAIAAVLLALSCGGGFGGVHAVNDTLAWNETLSDGQFLTSPGGNFRLGFFTPPNNSSGNRYVGVWYNNIPDPAVVWVANPHNPVKGRSGQLRFNATGALVIVIPATPATSGTNTTNVSGAVDVIWSSGANAMSNFSAARLLDTGNLVVTENANSDMVVWQGFDHPSNTLLPLMLVSQELKTGKKIFVTSWSSLSDPTPGKFVFGVEIQVQGLVQMFTWRYPGFDERHKYVRSGPWVNQKFIGMPEMHSAYMNGFDLSRNDKRLALNFAITDKTRIIRFVLEHDGVFRQWNWDAENGNWTDIWRKPDDVCDLYNRCGDFGVCDSSVSPSVCRCLRGFEPKFVDQWGKGNWSGGCRRSIGLQCENRNRTSSDAPDGFFKIARVKSPDFAHWLDIGSAAECQSWCMRNCSCLAYAYISGINCVVWDSRLVDSRIFDVGGEDLYLKLPHSMLGIKKNRDALVISLAVVFGTIIALSCAFITWRILLKRRRKRWQKSHSGSAKSDTKFSRSYVDPRLDVTKQADCLDMVLFEFDVILTATDHFSERTKLGEGGFGSVYKGTLPGGHEIAVKRLSLTSRQGSTEFKNEVVLISKLQHRNLVQLLGCCTSDDEKLLVYEFMPNKSLNHFLFDASNGEFLDWPKRFHIIQGIAQGLLYLHRDSRLRIVHRDLKASNILLDSSMNPKISDFGMARIVGDESLDITNRVVGTFGYMSPEYAMHGEFSEKSDVFSFGVLLLEVISGKKITSFFYDEESLNLVGYAWKFWSEDRSRELIEPLLLQSPHAYSEIQKCINIALLCVQELPKDRPNMTGVISMFISDVASIDPPKEPTFIGRRDNTKFEYLHDYNKSTTSTNEVTITQLSCR